MKELQSGFGPDGKVAFHSAATVICNGWKLKSSGPTFTLHSTLQKKKIIIIKYSMLKAEKLNWMKVKWFSNIPFEVAWMPQR